MKTLLFLTICILVVAANRCLNPSPSQNFTRSAYSGTWYEVAKYQTAGGAFFEKDCVCTRLDVNQNGEQYQADNICNYKTPTGKVTHAVGTLSDENPSNPGKFKEKFFFFTPSVDYTVLFLGEYNGEEYSVEYDCGDTSLGGLNYCVHFLSRKPNMSEELLNYLIDRVNQLNLNVENLPL